MCVPGQEQDDRPERAYGSWERLVPPKHLNLSCKTTAACCDPAPWFLHTSSRKASSTCSAKKVLMVPSLHGVQEASLLQNFSENTVGLLKSPRLKAKVQRFPHQLSTEPHLPRETCGVIL